MASRSTSKPNTRTSPASASTSVDSVRMSVDLPEPLAPISPKTERAADVERDVLHRADRAAGDADPGRRKPEAKLLVSPRTRSAWPGSGTERAAGKARTTERMAVLADEAGRRDAGARDEARVSRAGGLRLE